MSPWLVLVPVAVLALLTTFLWHRLTVAPGYPRRVRVGVAVLLTVLGALVLAGFDVWGGRFTPAQMRPFVWTGMVYLGSWLYLFLGLLGVWLVSVVIWVVRWRHDHGRAARRRLNRVAVPVVVSVSAAVTGYGVYEAANLGVTRHTVSSPQLPAAFDGARVALITDVHAGAVRSAEFTREVVDLVNAQRPDLVVVAGDVIDGEEARYGLEIAPLADLDAPLGVFAVTGNHEMFDDTANWVRRFEEVGLDVLQNESVALRRGGDVITLAGVHDATGEGTWEPDYDSALGGTDPAAFTLFTTHQPVQALRAGGRGVDLQLSGHVHGGQMWPIAYLVPLYQEMLPGLEVLGDVRVLASAGIGAWGPPVRVAAPPEVPVVTLRRG